MSGTLPPVYALLTALTALLVTTVLVPVLRLMLEPGVVLPRRVPMHTPAAAGSLSVLLGAAVLLPMGGDGLLVPFNDTPIAFGLFAALLLFFVGSSRVYKALPVYGRLGLQTAVAFLAALGGVHAQTGSTPIHFLSVAILLVAMNAFEALDGKHGLAAGAAAVTAGFLACVSPAFNEHGLGDLNLGLSGALFAVLVFQVVPQIRLRVELGTGGRLAIGFLIGVSYLRLGPQATPTAQTWMALPMLVPMLALVAAMLLPALRRVSGTFRPRRLGIRSWLGWGSAHLQAMGFLFNVTVAMATLRALGML